MKYKAYGNSTKFRNGILHNHTIVKKRTNVQNRLNILPYVVLRQLVSYIYGFDALAFADCVSTIITDSERSFWQSLGTLKTRKQYIRLPNPRPGFYNISLNYFFKISSDRLYSRFVFDAFLPQRLLSTMNSCNTDSFRTYSRLQSYSNYQLCYKLPIFSFFKYSFLRLERNLNRIEMLLYRTCRKAQSDQSPTIIGNLLEFETNLNNRFGFFHFKKFINFSLFLMAGGSVLNCLLINGFDSSMQDIDFFWIGGSWILFMNAIQRFKRKVSSQILNEINKNGKVIEFLLDINKEGNIKIQFIFSAPNANIPFILYTFDIDIVQVAYDGKQIISTIGFFEAINTKTFICYNLTNNILDTPLYLDRCFKYSNRGFDWLCPIQYYQILAQKPLIGEKKSIDYAFDSFYYNVDSFQMQDRFLRLNIFE